MNYASFYKAVTLTRMAEICAPHEWEYLEAAFNGDVDAAFSLSCALSNDKRGAVAVAMWRAKVKREAFREYFSSVWEHDHRYVIDAAQTRRTLGYMFRYAAFPIPADLPEVVTLWRGTSKLTIAEAREGYSWTTERDTACWFAMRFADINGSPLVLTAEVAKSDIALFTDAREESEALLIRSPAAVKIDGDVTDWQDGLTRYEARKNTRQRALYAA
ncbi:MAG: hypothetical protein I8H67_15140 [Comamonadaceae bacterium]|nr:hypothetical protein [Comamonadaceae bacterium]MBH2044289.1 hypothetical protein [Comamonadaceae bacterium]